MLLSVGHIVHYVLHKRDVDFIRKQRRVPYHRDAPVAIGGNAVSEGEHVSMIVTKIWMEKNANLFPCINGQCILDGVDQHWVTSVPFGENKDTGTWHWVERETNAY